ncbi:MAG: hypothetical protein ACK5Q5_00485 [Planctomycetaceae bacterium]
MKIESTDGETYEVKITPKIEFYVVGKGDAGFIQPGVYINGRGTKSNETIFINKVTAVLLPKGKRAPAGRIQKATVSEGESLQTFDVSGEIVSSGPVPDYPTHTGLELKLPAHKEQVWLEPDFEVEVASTDPAHATSGADVLMIMKPLAGGKLVPVALKVLREGGFDSKEVLPPGK